jgi:hypothetical protein
MREGKPLDKFTAASKAQAEINEEDNLLFSGVHVCVCVNNMHALVSGVSG